MKASQILPSNHICVMCNHIYRRVMCACLEALFLDAGLVKHIHIPCNLGQVIHLLPFHIAPCQKLLDVLLQGTITHEMVC